nr:MULTISPECIES: alpha/beta fold hydrolase [Rubrivivax]
MMQHGGRWTFLDTSTPVAARVPADRTRRQMRLARIQQATTIGGVLLAFGWAVHALAEGRPFAAAGGALLISLAYAAVLALEFACLRLAHGDDPAPRPSHRQLLRAWWGEVRSAPRVFCWQQPFCSRRWPDHLPADATGRRGVVFVHGFVCNRGVWNGWLARLRAAGVPYAAVDLEPVFGSIDAYVETIELAVQAVERTTGRPPVIVAHSMGGLALRRWWAERGDLQRVHRAITLGTPHRGTWLARFAFSLNGRQMRIGSGWLQSLQQREPPGLAGALTCFYSHCDNIVFPPSTATYPGADNRHLEGVAHVDMVDRAEPWNELQRWLADQA